jgi:hypothetical protein
MLNIKNRFNLLSPLHRNILLGISAIFATAGFGLAGIKYVVEPLNKSWQYATSQQPIKATLKVCSKETLDGHVQLCNEQRKCWILLRADVGEVYESIPTDRPIEISGNASRINYLSVKAINSPIIRVNGKTLWGPPDF